jgi:hypothetical protein
MQFAIPNRLLKFRRGLTIQRHERTRTKVRITQIFRARIHVVTRLARAAFDFALAPNAFARRGAYGAGSVIGNCVMNRIAAAAAIVRAWFVIVVDIGIVVRCNDFAIQTIVTSAIASDLHGQRPVGHIRIEASAIGLTLVDSA